MTSLPKHKPIHIHSFIYYTSLMLLNFFIPKKKIGKTNREDAKDAKKEKEESLGGKWELVADVPPAAVVNQ